MPTLADKSGEARMTVDEAILWCEENNVRFEWGQHPRTGQPTVAIYCGGPYYGEQAWDDLDAVARFCRMVERVARFREGG